MESILFTYTLETMKREVFPKRQKIFTKDNLTKLRLKFPIGSAFKKTLLFNKKAHKI